MINQHFQCRLRKFYNHISVTLIPIFDLSDSTQNLFFWDPTNFFGHGYEVQAQATGLKRYKPTPLS
jgi:hypothetical protein